MSVTTVRPQDAEPPLVLALDAGSSSVRALLYDAGARRVKGVEASQDHAIHTDAHGTAEEYPQHLLDAFSQVIDGALARAGALAHRIAAVGLDTYASNVLGLDREGNPVTPIYTYADSRPASDVERLRRELDVAAVHQRTGCPQHTAYLPGRFLWLRRTQPEVYRRVSRWVDVGTFLYQQWHGRADVPMCLSMASWTGLLDRRRLTWDEELLGHLGVSREVLPPLSDYDQPVAGLAGPWASRWKALKDVPFFLAVGDGASANVGSGCVGPGRVALTVGTTCAMRAVLQREPESLPAALWSYKVDRGHPLVGGALSEGGNVFAWLTGLLRLEEPPDLDQQLGKLPPDGHGLTVLPFLLGERSPGWRSDARAAIVGLRASTTPLEVLQAGMEAVAYRCSLVARALGPLVASDCQLIASGGALLRSPYWLQVFADVLDHPITASAEPEGTSRGTAILALKALGKLERLDAIPSALGETCFPDGTRAEIYRAAQERQAQLYRLLLDSSSGSRAS